MLDIRRAAGPGWPYSFVAALETGRSGWTAILDAVRIEPTDDLTMVTAAQVREVVNGLRGAARWCDGDPRILLVFDAGYDITRLACCWGTNASLRRTLAQVACLRRSRTSHSVRVQSQ